MTGPLANYLRRTPYRVVSPIGESDPTPPRHFFRHARGYVAPGPIRETPKHSLLRLFVPDEPDVPF